MQPLISHLLSISSHLFSPHLTPLTSHLTPLTSHLSTLTLSCLSCTCALNRVLSAIYPALHPALFLGTILHLKPSETVSFWYLTMVSFLVPMPETVGSKAWDHECQCLKPTVPTFGTIRTTHWNTCFLTALLLRSDISVQHNRRSKCKIQCRINCGKHPV